LFAKQESTQSVKEDIMLNLVCPFCGKTHGDRDAYVKCVNTCSTKEKQKEEEHRQKKLKDEVASRKQELKDAQNTYLDKINRFTKDYPNELIEYELPNLRICSTGDSFINDFLKEWDRVWRR
jgi:uncharacterized Zn finger protein (UPF0148 family)